MDYEKKYIDYVIKNVDKIDNKLLESFLIGDIEFNDLVETIDSKRYDIYTYRTFIKSEKLNDVLK